MEEFDEYVPEEVVPNEPETPRMGRGLKDFSRLVMDVVQRLGSSTYNEVADELIKSFDPVPESKVDQKNVRRRVYDALNVFMALGIINKDKKTIEWLGTDALHGDLDQEEFPPPSNNVVNVDGASMQDLKDNIAQLEEEIAEQKFIMDSLKMRNARLRNLLHRNFTQGQIPDENRVSMPFALIKTLPEATVDVVCINPNAEYKFKFSDPYETIDDFEVLEKLGYLDHEPLPLPKELAPKRPIRREVPVPIPQESLFPQLWHSVAPGMPPVAFPSSPNTPSVGNSPAEIPKLLATPEGLMVDNSLWHYTNLTSHNTTPKTNVPY